MKETPSSSAAPGRHMQVANSTTVVKPRPNRMKVLVKALWEEEDFRNTVLVISFFTTIIPSTFFINHIILSLVSDPATASWSWAVAILSAFIVNFATGFLVDTGMRAVSRNYSDVYEREERRLSKGG